MNKNKLILTFLLLAQSISNLNAEDKSLNERMKEAEEVYNEQSGDVKDTVDSAFTIFEAQAKGLYPNKPMLRAVYITINTLEFLKYKGE